MDLGIAGRTAIVCASSKGLGRACATELARAGCRVIVNGRDRRTLEQTAEAIRRETDAEVIAIAADLSTADGRAKLINASGKVDILVNNNGGPPGRDFREVDHEALFAGIEANMAAPIALIQAVIDGMIARRFGRIVNITSGSVKMPIGGLDLSSGARAGLTAFVAGVARQVAHANVTINGLLPGSFDTDRIASMLKTQSEKTGRSIEDLRRAREESVPAKRLGEPAEFGAACAFLCSAQAGYITGQNLLIDGGAFPGVL